ncbi:MAG TPA: hypothetical protein ENJ42_01025 [Hellea balneolensis]|uniref:PhoD-like phosphatase metallophosphatase domain-containing protein n=1 Tax=Hellea balneolensis TaxID=287478 RepID=A0A7C5M207_9PROT|nr:hypothetical protein [Hellea balneolensis]
MGIELGRIHNPTHEIISLSDYRTRHAQYKAEPQTQAMHAAHPMIAIWDDHEISNNSWRDGAQNHSQKEGPWEMRKAAAMQAYYEWMPVREPKPGRARENLFRAFDYGDLLNLCTIETRLTARVREIDYNQYADTFTDAAHIQAFTKDILGDESRELLGAAQREYVVNTLSKSKHSGQKWRLIANQVTMARVILPDIRDWVEKGYIEDIKTRFKSIEKFVALSPLGLPMNLDAWDGYPAARERLYADLSAQGVNDLLVLTGDTHVWWANRLDAKNGTKMGIELGGSSVTSPGFGTYLGAASEDFEHKVVALNDDVEYLKINTHGYIDLKLAHEGGSADFVTVSTVKEPNYTTKILKSFALQHAGNSIGFSDG